MDRLLDPGVLEWIVPLVAIVGALTLVGLLRWAKHKERMVMIEQGLDPDERAKQHTERMAMIKQGMDPDEHPYPAVLDDDE